MILKFVLKAGLLILAIVQKLIVKEKTLWSETLCRVGWATGKS